MNFTSIVHGAIGHLIADYLQLHPLAQWSRCNRNGRSIVEYKYSHMRRFSLNAHYKFTTIEKFAALCARLRGIEVLEYSTHSPALLEENVFMNRVTPHWRTMRDFYELIKANAHRLRVINQTEEAPSNEKEKTRSLAYEQEVKFHLSPILALVPTFPNIQVLELVAWTQPGEVDMLCESMRSSGDKKQRDDNDTEMLDSGMRIDPIPHQISTSVPILSEEEYEKYRQIVARTQTPAEVVAAAFPPISSTENSLILSPSPSPSDLRLTHLMFIDLLQLHKFVATFPQLESLQCAIRSSHETTEAWMDKEQVQNKTHQDLINSSYMELRFADGRSRAMDLFSNLLFLKIDFTYFALPPDCVLEFNIPTLLQLHITSSPKCNVSDLILNLPEAVTITIGMPFRASASHLAEQGIVPKPNPFVDVVYFPMPPSLISSLRRSTKLRNLNCSVYKDLPMYDYSRALESAALTPEEKQQMEIKAKELGQGGLFTEIQAKEFEQDELFQPGMVHHDTRREHCCRILYYALSVLPCGATLQMIDESPRYISLLEYFTLFPSMVSLAQTPGWGGLVDYFRPESREDGGDPNYVKERIARRYRLANKKSEESNPLRMDCINYWQIAHHLARLPLKAVEVVAKNGRLEHLLYLFLFALPNVDSAAITLLFKECKLLEHASLMQLPGVGDQSFVDLPADFTLPSLRSFRIKTACGVKDRHDVSFTANVIPRLTQLFPRVSHFEFLLVLRPSFDTAVSAVFKTLTHILAFHSQSQSPQLIWPNLRILTLNQPPSSSATDRELQEALLTRRDTTTLSSHLSLSLNYAHTLGVPQPLDSHWHLPPHTTTTDPNREKEKQRMSDMRGEMELKIEHLKASSCYKTMCKFHDDEEEEKEKETAAAQE